jgi:hypothetical protein
MLPNRKPPAAGKGRKKGVPNRVTADVREVIAMCSHELAPDLIKWIRRTAKRNPAKAAELFLRAIEYHIPKVSKLELSGPGGGPLSTVSIDTSDPVEAGRAYQRIIRGK